MEMPASLSVPADELELETEPEPVQLGRDLILQAKDLPMERVDVPEWGGFVYVRTLTGMERDRFEADSLAGKGKDRHVSLRNIRARLVVLATCNERGERIFVDADVDAIGRKSSAALDRIFSVAQRLSRVSDDDVEDLAKNSEGDPAD
jgi:hypothetical protein